MSPEQSDGDAATPASDWYSVGVVLYHSLSGRVPFEGKSAEILRDKHRRDPPPLAMPDVPSDIADLCADLLLRDPTLRPDGRAVLKRIGKSAPIEIPREAKSPFIGREDQLQQLRSGYQALCQRRPVAVLLSGQSGTGKSALTTEFLKGISDDRDLLVLSARCYKQENVPYKAVDGLVDALSRFLCTLSPERADAFLPQDIRALSRVFPALQQVAAVNQALQRDHFSSNQQDLRWRAFTALRELLTRLGDRKRLVMIIDDLQWGDSDSTALLNSVLRQPDGPVALFLGVFRSEDRDASESLALLVEAMRDAQQISLDSLTEEQSYRLARSLIDELSSADDNDEVARRIAVESSGNPFFLLELARSMVRDASPRSDGHRLTLEEVLWSRIEQLPEQSRCLLYTLSVAGQPLQYEYASVASQIDIGQTSSTLSMLRNERLIRDCGHEREALIDTYHDRVREIVIARLGEVAQTQCHRRLAESGEALPQPDVEFLALHFRLANESERAAFYYLQAADQASHKLAFNRAADFCAEALRLHEFSAARRIEVRRKIADALASGGRNVEAAQEYLALADDLEGAGGLEMRRRAFTQFLLTGWLAEGMVTLRNVLAQLGLSLPSTPRIALVSLLVTRLRLWLRGPKLHLIAADKISPADLLRVDVLWSVAISLTRIDSIRGALFVAKGCLEALRVGEVSRIARGLGLEGSHLSIPGRRTSRRSLQLIETAKNLAATLENSHVRNHITICEGIRSGLLGEWESSLLHCQQAEQGFVSNEVSELTTVRFWHMLALIWLGKMAELQRRCPPLVRSAQERGDLYELVNLGTYAISIVKLAQDRPREAWDDVNAVMNNWTRDGFHIQHHLEVIAKASILLYEGNHRDAGVDLRNSWPLHKRSFLWGAHLVRANLQHLRARIALGAARNDVNRRMHIREARRALRALEKERLPWTTALAVVGRGSLAAILGDVELATKDLEQAAASFDSLGMELYAAVSRRRLGQILGGQHGRELIDVADEWMRGQEIRAPAKMAEFLVPGFDDPS